MAEKYLYGQGRVKLAEIISNVTQPWVWAGDVSELSLAFEEEKADHKESYSGKKAKVREFTIGTDMTMSATVHQFSGENISRFTRGSVTNDVSGTVTAEVLGTVTAGIEVSLAQIGVSGVVITDSAGTPATIDASHYSVDANFGNIVFNTLPTAPAPTMPLKAAYSYAAAEQVAFLNAEQKQIALRYEGINLAEGGAPVLVELYKVSPGLLQELGLITTGSEVAGMSVEGAVLLDTRKPAGGELGQFGRIIQLAPV